MSVRRVSPAEAWALVQDGYVFVDVRSEPEFEAGHPEGAHNVPIAFLTSGGMAPNPDFLAVMSRHFARGAPIVLGCKSGGRSLRAAEVLVAAGFTGVVDQRAGFGGNGVELGWAAAGLPVATGPGGDKSWSSLK